MRFTLIHFNGDYYGYHRGGNKEQWLQIGEY